MGMRTAAAGVVIIMAMGAGLGWAMTRSSDEPKPADARTAKVADLAWMSGSWAFTKGDTRTEEHWTLPAGGTMLGMSRIVRGEKTAMFEFCRIEIVDGVPAFLAQPRGRTATVFKLAHAGPREAVFENPAHDFPQRIIYRREADDRLMARVEGKVKGEVVGEDYPFVKAGDGVRLP